MRRYLTSILLLTYIILLSGNRLFADSSESTPPAGSIPADTIPAEIIPIDTFPADTIPLDTVPVDTIPVDTVAPPPSPEFYNVKVSPAEAVIVSGVTDLLRILSLNNSLISCYDENEIFENTVRAANRIAKWTTHSIGGATLAQHWNEGDSLRTDSLPSARMMVRDYPWSHIILQEHSRLPLVNFESFRSNIRIWVDYIRRNCPNPNVVIILPVNWAYFQNLDNYLNSNSQMIANYKAVAEEFGVVLSPSASGFSAMFEDYGEAGLKGMFLDDRHPSLMSTYMSSCMLYGQIYNVDPREITYIPDGLTSEKASLMRGYASRILKEFNHTIYHHDRSLQFRIEVTDRDGNAVDPEELTFGVNGNTRISSKGKFTFMEEGEYPITFNYKGFETRAMVRVGGYRVNSRPEENPDENPDDNSDEDPDLTVDVDEIQSGDENVSGNIDGRISVFFRGKRVIIFGATPSAQVNVFDSDGKLLKATREHEFDLPESQSVILINVDGCSFKALNLL